MRKLVVPFSFICLIFLFSCQHDNSKKSFSEIIKEDSSRKQELIQLADSLQMQLQRSGTLDRFEVNPAELDNLRGDMPGKIKIDKKNPPIFSIRIGDLLEIIDYTKPINNDNRLVFILGTYKTQPEVDKYNLLAGTTYKLSDLEHIPNLFVGWQSASLTPSPVYAVSYVCPPPYDGTCNSTFKMSADSSQPIDSAAKLKK